MSLRKEIIEVKGVINKVYDHIVEILKIVNKIDNHSYRIQKLETKVEKLEMNITEIKVAGCAPIQEGEEINFNDITEALKK